MMYQNYRILCLDPKSEVFYSMLIDYDTNPEIIVYKDIPEMVENKRKNELKKVREMCDLSQTDKFELETQEMQNYRKRKLPKYLIRENECDYPKYLCKSQLSDAFSDREHISLQIGLNYFKDQLIDEQQQQVLDRYGNSVDLSIQLEADLVMSSKQLIKYVVRQVHNKYKKLVEIKKENEYCFKVRDFEEYIYGDDSLMDYESARNVLRDHQTLYLTFQSKPKQKKKQSYVFGKDQEVDWKVVEQTEVLFWYSPIELADIQQLESQIINKQLKTFRFVKKDVEYQKWFAEWRVEVMKSLKDKEDYLERCIFTGEHDFQMSFSINNIENFQKIIDVDQNSAHLFNGVEPYKHISYDPKNSIIKSIQKHKELDRKPLMMSVILQIQFYNGTSELLNQNYTIQLKDKENIFEDNFVLNRQIDLQDEVLISMLSQESKLCISIKVQQKFNMIVVGSGSLNLFDEWGEMIRGKQKMTIWPYYMNDPRISCRNQFLLDQSCWVNVEFMDYKIPVYWSLRDQKVIDYIDNNKVEQRIMMNSNKQAVSFENIMQTRKMLKEKSDKKKKGFFQNIKDKIKEKIKGQQHVYSNDWQKQATLTEISQLKRIFSKDSLELLELDRYDKQILLQCRYDYMKLGKGLIYFLRSVDLNDPEQIKECYSIIYRFEKPQISELIILLDSWMSDEYIRYYTVQQISKFQDDELVLYMLQLVQSLQFESTHFSPLAELLIQRSIQSPHTVGHELFWQIRTYLVKKPSYERYLLILEQFVMLVGSYREKLYSQFVMNNKIADISEDVKSHKLKPQQKRKNPVKVRKKLMQQKIKQVQEQGQIPKTYSFAFDTRITSVQINHKECSLFSSKKLPICLSFRNLEDRNFKVIFKTGDDLRMDMVAIQLIRIMDKLWLDNGIDLRMRPYKVVSTWDQVGVIELVPNSATISSIHEKYGGNLGAFEKETILKFVQQYNQPPDQFAIAQDNFIRSCAGYCVATFIMGIGDRHNGNIMVAKSGHFFHIDFGHFLGNFKSKFGIKRERTFFVFSREMEYLICYQKKSNYQLFQNLCAQAYNCIRQYGNFLIDMFLMMLTAGMPELSKLSDLQYLKDRLEFSLTTKQAEQMFQNELQRSKDDKYRIFDNQIHNMKHSSKSKKKK